MVLYVNISITGITIFHKLGSLTNKNVLYYNIESEIPNESHWAKIKVSTSFLQTIGKNLCSCFSQPSWGNLHSLMRSPQPLGHGSVAHPQPVRNPSCTQEESGRQASKASSVTFLSPRAHITAWHPHCPHPHPWKNCLPQNRSLVSERLGITDLTCIPPPPTAAPLPTTSITTSLSLTLLPPF